MRISLVILTTILTSFYFFPFEFAFLPGVNTKMAMAGVGLVWFILNLVQKRQGTIDKRMFILSILAMTLSVFSLIAMIYNNTRDGSFLTYFISMWVWLGGAYMAINVMKKVHGYVSVKLVCHYLIAVCVSQCILAYAMALLPALKNIIDSFLGGQDAFMGKAEGRLYGIGAALDVAGIRYAAVLVIIAVLLQSVQNQRRSDMWLYLIAFLIISVFGNMMARTTTVGVIIALIYWAISSGTFTFLLRTNSVRIWKYLIIILSLSLPIIIYLYSSNEQFQENIRFAFEGFFSLAETGKWETSSNEILLNHMIVFPETLKTWLIGDGYGANPLSDPYYIGPQYHGFYMGTDIGYLRFLFYFGIFGLVALVSVICYAASICVQRFTSYRTMFYLILLVNLIVWCKVSTDIFMLFALFLCVSKEDNDAYEKEYEDSIPDSLDV